MNCRVSKRVWSYFNLIILFQRSLFQLHPKFTQYSAARQVGKLQRQNRLQRLNGRGRGVKQIAIDLPRQRLICNRFQLGDGVFQLGSLNH
jgi:hypothetical protein